MKKHRIVAGLGLGLALAAFAAPAPAAHADVPVATFFEHSNFGGINWTQMGLNYCTGTTADVDYQQYNMLGFNDVVSSFQGKSACWVKLFQHDNFGGIPYGYTGSSAYVGDQMNDQASSYKIS